MGPPGTWEVSFSPPESRRLGAALKKVQARRTVRPRTTGSEGRGARVEPRSEGNEATRGGETSEPLSSTEEAGELSPGDPVEGRRRPVYGTSGGKDDTDIEP
jgi:hypothetical protein